MPLLPRAQAPTSSETSFARPASSRQKLGLVCCTATWLLTHPFHRNTHIYTCFAVTLCDSHQPVWRSLADCKLVFQPLAPQFFVAPVPVQNAYWNLNCPLLARSPRSRQPFGASSSGCALARM